MRNNPYGHGPSHDVQQVTTQSKAKTMEWETQEAVEKVAIVWVKEANKWNVDDMQQEGAKYLPTFQSVGETDTIEEDPAWQALTECQIMMPLGRLLQLVPLFTENLKMMLAPPEPAVAPTYFTNPNEGLTIIEGNSNHQGERSTWHDHRRRIGSKCDQ